MSDYICKETMARCQTPGMCSPHGGCRPKKEIGMGHIDLGQFVDWVWNLKAERDELKAEIAGLKTGYEAYEQTVKELRAEVEALRKDAERYRWLNHGHSGYIEVVEWIGPHATGMTGDDLDTLVDTAMSQAVQP